MNEENQVYFVDSDKLPEEALKRKHRLEQDPSFRTNHMEYMEGMEVIQSDIKDKVEAAMKAFDYDAYTAADQNSVAQDAGNTDTGNGYYDENGIWVQTY